MKLILFTTLSVIFIVWLFDLTPMTTSVTAYRAHCEGDLITYDKCYGDLQIGEVTSFVTSSHRSEVLKVTEHSLPESLGTCVIKDRKNWHCEKHGLRGKVDFYWMTNSLYVHNTNGKENSIPRDRTLPIVRHEWVKTYVTSIPTMLKNWLQKSKDSHFKQKVYDATTPSDY